MAAGADPSAMAAMLEGETKASGARSRMCRSTLFSSRAISAREETRPWTRSSIQPLAFAMAVKRASWVSGFTADGWEGAWKMPFTAVRLGAVQGSVIAAGARIADWESSWPKSPGGASYIALSANWISRASDLTMI